MRAIVKNAGMASPMYRQLISVTAFIIMEPTRINTHPVAQGGMDAKMGAKKTATKNAMPVVHDVRPVFPPSEIPAPDSTKAVTGGLPKREPMEIEIASTIWKTGYPGMK